MTILGISLGTSQTGVCVLEDGVLLDRNVHNFPARWSDAKLHAILARYRTYLQKHRVSAVMVKIPPENRRGAAIRRLMWRTEALAGEYCCKFDYTTKEEMGDYLLLKSMDEMIRYSVQLHPELTSMYLKGKPKKHSTQKKIYEAILAAHTYKRKREARAEPTTE